MSTTKKNIKVRDLKPSKDAKGGGATRAGHTLSGHTLSGHTLSGHTSEKGHHRQGGTSGNR